MCEREAELLAKGGRAWYFCEHTKPTSVREPGSSAGSSRSKLSCTSTRSHGSPALGSGRKA